MTKKFLITPLLLMTLGGCAYNEPSPVVMTPPAPAIVTSSAPPVVMTPVASQPTVVVPADRVVAYQEGRWQLYGDGRSTPYYWVWVPTGSTLTANPSPPARPASNVATVPPSNRVISYPEGRWQLYGDGRTMQYYWVWIPSGVTPPTPPIPPAQAG